MAHQQQQQQELLLGQQPQCSSSLFASVWQELKVLLFLAGPMILVNLTIMALQLSSIIFVGHLDELSLARATIATSLFNIVGLSLLFGTANALDTYCGQAYGAKEYQLVGFYLLQGVVGLNVLAIPLAIIFVFVGDILQALGQDVDIAVGAGHYTRYLIPGLFAMASSQPLFRFLLAQSRVGVVLSCSFASMVCHLIVCWLLVYSSGMGYKGAAVAFSISCWILCLLVAAYVQFSKACERCRASWSWKVFKDLKVFYQLAIPSGAMTCLEWWCAEVLVLLAGLLPNPKLQASTLSVCLNTAQALFQVPCGIGAAASVRVSNELGGGDAGRARRAVNVALGFALSEALTLSIILLFIHGFVGRIYSSDEEVISYVSSITPLLSANVFLDAVQATLSGVARGCGLQKFGAVVNLFAYYCVGLPLGCSLAFLTPLQARGLWATLLCGPFVQASCLAIVIGFKNWDKLVLEAAARLDGSAAEPLLLDSGVKTGDE